MGSDRARVSYDPRQQYRSVVMQQGRVTLEADFNEELAIAGEELRKETLDVVGPCGTPDNGYLITPLAKPAFDFSIGPGAMYVGGVRVTTSDPMPGPGPLQYSNQQEWLDHTDDPDWVDITVAGFAPTNEFVYLFLREQEVSAVEDSDLKDVALGGPDTAQRTRLIQHVVRLADGSTCAAGLAAAQTTWTGEGLKFNTATMRLQSVAALQVGFSPSGPPPDVCNPQAQGGYLGADNQLIRVQISGKDNKTGNPKFVWGFDDASFLYRLDLDPNNNQLLHLQSRPVDAAHQPQANQAVEVLRSAAQLSNGEYIASLSGFVVTLDQPYNPDTQMVSLPASQPALPDEYYNSAATPRAFLRVWEQEIVFTPGTAVSLGNTGMQVTLQAAGKVFHTGDYWLFAVRPSTPQQVYPERYLTRGQPPDGPRMWACPLGVLAWNGHSGTLAEDCRNPFDNLVNLTKRKGLGGCCTVSVSPKDLTGNNTLQSVVDQLVTPAIALSAADPGSPGNDITFTIANVIPDADPLKTQLSVGLFDLHTYTGLTLPSIQSTLAASAGLVQVSGQVTQGLAPQSGAYALQGGAANTKASVTIKNVQSGTAFTLQAKKPGASGNNTSVSIANVNTGTGTFDLTVKYVAVATSITLSELGQNSDADLAYDVVVAPPSGGFAIPLAGATDLTGGKDDKPSAAATATIYADQQPKVCLGAGTYSLPKTLELGIQHSGLTVEACGGEAILKAADGTEANFLQGLMMLNAAANISLRGLTFNLPAVPFAKAGGKLAGLNATALNNAQGPEIEDLIVGIGLRPLACSNLTVDDCTFNFQVEESGVFEAGILASGSNSGFTLEHSKFSHQEIDRIVTESTFAVRIGYLLTPSVTITSPVDAAGAALNGTVVESSLVEASFATNQFTGLTAAAVIYAATTGRLDCESNTVRNCYSGFWVLSLQSMPFADELKTSQLLAPALVADPVLFIGSSLARAYPLPADFQVKPIAVNNLAAPQGPPSNLTNDQLRRYYRLQSGLTVIEKAASTGAPTELSLIASLNNIQAIQLLAVGAVTSFLSNEAIQQVDQSSSGFLVWLGQQDTNSNIVFNGNIVQNNNDNARTVPLDRVSGLPTVVVLEVVRAAITGNQIINLGAPAEGGSSLVLIPVPSQAATPPVAVTGNVFQRPAQYPLRAGFTPALQPPFNSWDFMNTVIP